MQKQSDTADISKLLDIMAALRDPVTGCPWDLAQDFETIAPYTIEEAYEVADCIARDALDELPDELGDLLFQVVFHAQMASDRKLFGFADVVGRICAKLIRRHPHVFDAEGVPRQPDAVSGGGALGAAGTLAAAGRERTDSRDAADSADSRDGRDSPDSADHRAEVARSWDRIKRAERPAGEPLLAGIALALPALTRARKLGKRAASVGFDWRDAAGARAKIDEELAELDAAIVEGLAGRGASAAAQPAATDAAVAADADPEADASAPVHAECGDLLFSIVNYCRHLGVDAEKALRDANERFARRFGHVEAAVRAAGGDWQAFGEDALDALWTEAKGRDEA